MAPVMATSRLRKELQKLIKDPPPGVIAEPVESDILTWHYAIEGPKDTPFENGVYVGKLKFPNEYPMKAPSIYMLTPSGRFQIGTKICMSMSDFHPESWNPLWSVSSIIQGIQSFMASSELTTGGMRAPVSERKKLAALSVEYNRENFPKLFEGDIDAAFARAAEARLLAAKHSATKNATSLRTNNSANKLSTSRASKSSSEKTKRADETTANGGDNNNIEDVEDIDAAEEQLTPELTPEEIERRRKKNAKKRAKQKAKKAASAATAAEKTTEQLVELSEAGDQQRT